MKEKESVPLDSLQWDGEKIKRRTEAQEVKFGPKELLQGIDNTDAEIFKMKHDIERLKTNIKNLEESKRSAEAWLKKLKEFEKKSEEIQIGKLKDYVKKLHEELYEKAKKEAAEEIAKDPNAMDDSQKHQLPYLKYQKALATHPKVAENIAQRIIKKYLYEEPVFDNPFATTGSPVATKD